MRVLFSSVSIYLFVGWFVRRITRKLIEQISTEVGLRMILNRTLIKGDCSHLLFIPLYVGLLVG